jgi:hypothetical protein
MVSLECGVCMDEVTQMCIVPCCNHIVCTKCAVKWTQRSATCPWCRHPWQVASETTVLHIRVLAAMPQVVVSAHAAWCSSLRTTLQRCVGMFLAIVFATGVIGTLLWLGSQ